VTAAPGDRAFQATGGARDPGWDPRFFEKSPLFWPIRRHAARFEAEAAFPAAEACDRLLAELAGVRFRQQPPKPSRRRRKGPVDMDALYDTRITVEGWVPTRAGSWHDLLNALVWAAFPRAKRALHARQHRLFVTRLDPHASRLPGQRTREQDTLALLDEGSIALLFEPRLSATLTTAVIAGDTSKVREAVLGGGACAIVFGHALYEHLVRGEARTIWAMVSLLPCPGPLPAGDAPRVALADALLESAIVTPGSFATPEGKGSLPLDPRVLTPEA
jgi:hypothetical protein